MANETAPSDHRAQFDEPILEVSTEQTAKKMRADEKTTWLDILICLAILAVAAAVTIHSG